MLLLFTYTCLHYHFVRAGLPKRWSKIEINETELDAAWRDGDDPDDPTDDELLYAETEERRNRVPENLCPRGKAAQGIPREAHSGELPGHACAVDMRKMTEGALGDVDFQDKLHRMKHQQSMSGPAMMFVELTPRQPETGETWSKTAYDSIAQRWKDLLFTGGVDGTVYQIEEGKMLLTMKKGWYGPDGLAFLQQRREVVSITWDNQKYYGAGEVVHAEGPSDSVDPDRRGSAAPKRRRRSKRKRTITGAREL